MTRRDTIGLAIGAACAGHTDALRQILLYFALVGDIPLDRIVGVAYRQFGMPKHIAWRVIADLTPELIQ